MFQFGWKNCSRYVAVAIAKGSVLTDVYLWFIVWLRPVQYYSLSKQKKKKKENRADSVD